MLKTKKAAKSKTPARTGGRAMAKKRPPNTWQLQDAKDCFSEVVSRAVQGEDQLVTRHGKPAVYVVAAGKHQPISKKKESIWEFFAPLREAGLDLDAIIADRRRPENMSQPGQSIFDNDAQA